MSVFAAVMTGKGTGAIATVCVIGNGAGDIIKSIFKSHQQENREQKTENKRQPVRFETGQILLGHIVDSEKVIDEVVVGCEGENEFAINCHGNPLIVEMIMELLVKHGAEAATTEQFLKSKIQNLKSKIAAEATLLQLKAKTIEGYRLLQNQIDGGLSAKAAEWLNTESLEQIQNEADAILKVSSAGLYIIHGCKVVLAGPANSGKSTLLNSLAGRDKSIVADIPGTTRDWISAHCTAGSLAMEVVDTAGLNETLTLENTIDKEAQKRSVQLIEKADVIIWVIDGSDEKLKIKNEKLKIKNKIFVMNKCDLGLKIDKAAEREFEEAVVISAKNGTGIDELTKKIRTILGVEGFDLKQAAYFTDRQQKLLEKLPKAENKPAAHSIITELLNGHLSV